MKTKSFEIPSGDKIMLKVLKMLNILILIIGGFATGRLLVIYYTDPPISDETVVSAQKLAEAKKIIKELEQDCDYFSIPYDQVQEACTALSMSEYLRESELPENKGNPDYVIDGENLKDIREYIEDVRRTCY